MTRFLFAAALAASSPALAQMPAMSPAPACTQVEIAPGFEAWNMTGGTTPAIGQPAGLTLAPAIGQNFTPPLKRAPQVGSYGGTVPFTILTAGVYRIALSQGAWIDVIGAVLTPVPSVAHNRGPACSGIAKIVDFALQPGTYQLQLSEAKAPAIKVMVAPAR